MNQSISLSAKKVALGLSGGVDSAAAAQLLVEQGYQVTAVFLECWRAPGCRSEEDRKDALKIALDLNIPFQVLDFRKAYKDKVVEYFFAEYQTGHTPNPDVLCNKEIKFGLFYDWAMEQGFDFVATGHYAKNVVDTSGKHQLAIPKDMAKDQTYFLYLLEESQLQHILFPLSDLTKSEVREYTRHHNLHVANKKDSVGICFIGDINVHHFLKERLGENPGEVVNTQGRVIGKHQGLWFYTIGQRHGFEVNKKIVVKLANGSELERDNIPPFYVIAKKPAGNQLVVGFGAETYRQIFAVENLHLIAGDNLKPTRLMVRIRHTGQLLACKANTIGTRVLVHLRKPIQGLADGQAAVFYVTKAGATFCLGGGTITN